MEVLGAVASVIAIGQALGALPKIVDKLKSLGDVKGELADLLNELATLTGINAQIQQAAHRFQSSHAAFSDAVPQETMNLLESTIADIKQLVQDLETLIQSFPKPDVLRKRQVTHMVKWKWRRPKVIALRNKANKARTDLQILMSMLLMAGQTMQLRLLVDFTTTTIPESGRPLKSMQDAIQQETTPPQGKANSQTPVTATGSQGIAFPTPSEDSDSLYAPVKDASGEMLQFKAMFQWQCTTYCACQCHSRRSDYRSPAWLRSIVGRLFLSYQSRPLWGSIPCDEPSCRNSKLPVSLDYYFPSWVMNRAICVSLSSQSLYGISAGLQVNLPRLLPLYDTIWWAIDYGEVRNVAKCIIDAGILPWDKTPNGSSLIAHIVMGRRQDLVECILQIWPHQILRKSSDTTTVARLKRDMVLVKDEYLLIFVREIKKLLAVWNEETISDLDHDQEISSSSRHQQSWLDDALQRACITGDVGNMIEIIGQGANIDSQDMDGKTPLMLATLFRNAPCALELLKRGCNVHIRDDVYGHDVVAQMFGTNEWIFSDRIEILRHLPLNELVAASRLYGRRETIIHRFATTNGPPDLLCEAYLLLSCHELGLEALDQDGETPLMWALWSDNPTTFRILRDNGANMKAQDGYGNGILHFVAVHAGGELIRALEESQLAIDIDMRANYGGTALYYFEFSMLLKDEVNFYRRPYPLEVEMFEKLLRNVRDRYLRSEIKHLQSIIELLQADKTGETEPYFEALIKEKEMYRKSTELKTLRVIRDVQIRQGMMDAALEALEEIIEVHEETMLWSPFEKMKYDWSDSEYSEVIARILGARDVSEVYSDEEDWEEEEDGEGEEEVVE